MRGADHEIFLGREYPPDTSQAPQWAFVLGVIHELIGFVLRGNPRLSLTGCDNYGVCRFADEGVDGDHIH